MFKMILFSVFLLFNSNAFAELSKSAERLLEQQAEQVDRARQTLIVRTQTYNRIENALNHLTSKNEQEVVQAIKALNLTPKQRGEIEALRKKQDYKAINSFARSELLVAFQRQVHSREEWEKQFSSPWSKETKDELHSHHLEIAEKNHLVAQEKSKIAGISLETVKSKKLVEAFCQDLPKGGQLHTHPYGTMDRATVKTILAVFNPTVDPVMIRKYLISKVERIHESEIKFLDEKISYYSSSPSYRDVLKKYPEDAVKIQDFFFMPSTEKYYNDEYTPFSRFLAAFALPLEMLGILTGNTAAQIQLEKIIYDALFLRSIGLRLDYMEITRNLPVLVHTRNFEERYDELLRWTKAAEGIDASRVIYPRTLLSFNRTSLSTDERRLSQVSTMTQLLQLPPSPYLVGINLMGDENLVSALDASQLIYGKLLVAQQDGGSSLMATIHAGELGDPRNLRDAIVFGVERIGHGVKFMEEPQYLELALQNQVAIESNLTSNEILKVRSIKDNPFLFFHRVGLRVSLSTDDEGMFETDQNLECVRAIQGTDIEYWELQEMMKNSIETSFADLTLKNNLRDKLSKDLLEFQVRWREKLAQ
jgi:adenosine deaminase CECR1